MKIPIKFLCAAAIPPTGEADKIRAKRLHHHAMFKYFIYISTYSK